MNLYEFIIYLYIQYTCLYYYSKLLIVLHVLTLCEYYEPHYNNQYINI